MLGKFFTEVDMKCWFKSLDRTPRRVQARWCPRLDFILLRITCQVIILPQPYISHYRNWFEIKTLHFVIMSHNISRSTETCAVTVADIDGLPGFRKVTIFADLENHTACTIYYSVLDVTINYHQDTLKSFSLVIGKATLVRLTSWSMNCIPTYSSESSKSNHIESLDYIIKTSHKHKA